MPKVTGKSLPLSGLFAIDKPSGYITMKLLNSINDLLASSELFLTPETHNPPQHRFKKKQKRRGKVKLGQGGTLDPLASGVLVLGVNNGTKRLSAYLHGTKEYKVTGLFGSATDSYDSEGKIIRTAPFTHLSREKVEAVLDRFRGEIKQLPPIYSALKMDGKPLYEYARQGIPLPKPIEARKCTIYNLELIGWKDGNEHSWTGSTIDMSEEEKSTMLKLESMIQAKTVDDGSAASGGSGEASIPAKSEAEDTTTMGATDSKLPVFGDTKESHSASKDIARPPSFELKMTVSSGTYVRSLVHDIANAVDSAAHVVELVRTRQGPFALDPTTSSTVDGEDTNDPLHGVVSWKVLEDGIKHLKIPAQDSDNVETNSDTMSDWEAAIVKALL